MLCAGQAAVFGVKVAAVEVLRLSKIQLQGADCLGRL